MITKEMEVYAKEKYEETIQLIRDIAPIPAPSHHEDKRVEWLVKYFENIGAKGVYVDEVKNVIWPYNVTEDNDLLVVMAHTDVVFPDTTPLPYKEDDEYIYCPGIGDDTARLGSTIMAARFFIESGKLPKDGMGVLFVANSCEEGLGNSMGAFTVLKNYGKRVKWFVSDDSLTPRAVNHAVGSHRYEIKVTTKGGHSWSDFGNKNSIQAMAELLCDLYTIEVPVKEGTKTTLNVGEISGGTSVNTIAQSARCLFEYRSDDAECLAYMKSEFEKRVAAHQSDIASFEVELLGARPCNGDIDKVRQGKLEKMAVDALKETLGLDLVFKSGSTDANFPLSMGIPAITIGTSMSTGVHTREEKLEKASVYPGMRYYLAFLGNFFEGCEE